MFTVWLALLLVGVPAGAEELARGEGEDNASPLTWLVETLTLEETQRQVASWFGHPPSVQHAGSITILSFSDSPGLSPHAEGSHSDRADHDACNAQPQWSFQFRAGRLVSVVWNPPDGTAIELPNTTGSQSKHFVVDLLRAIRPFRAKPAGEAPGGILGRLG